jgi:hypothetical protein
MNRKLALGTAGVALVATYCLGFLWVVPEGRSQPQSPPPALTTDEKLNQILSRLDKIDKRLAELGQPAAAPRAVPPEAVAPALREAAGGPPGQLPFVANKPKPHSSTYKGCDSRGDDRGDQDLNYLKNRIDEADVWMEVDFKAVLGQPYPLAVGKHHRADWEEENLVAVKRYEGLPVAIVCYFAWAKDEGPESCNCHTEEKAMYDIHTWLTKDPAQIEGNRPPDRSLAIVAEVTPRLKANHPAWSQAAFRKLARDRTQVRVSGWLLLDQEHPEQTKPASTRPATRGTLWEIHPIMEIEVWENGRWVPLDDRVSVVASTRLLAA